MAHDQLLRLYLNTEESKELSASFREKREPNSDKFGQ
jgi:naphthoate synthase